MSGREWQPGDVAVNLHHGYRGIFVPECLNTSHSNGPHWHNQSGLADGPHDVRRPLVVIDPEDAEQVERLARARQQAWDGPGPHTQVSAMQAALREFASPKPPCGASLTLGKDGALHRCAEAEGHAGPHVDGTCIWGTA